jgi:D-alanine-D-alanine ligase
MRGNPATNELREICDWMRAAAEDLAVILVINVRGETMIRTDYDSFSVVASFLHDFEIDEIIRSLRSYGIYTVHFADEVDFIRWYASGGYAAVPRRRKLLYSSAINGTGPGRKSLIPAFCALERIPTANSNPHVCSLTRHKFHWNRLLHGLGLPVPRCWAYDARTGWFMGESPPVGLHVIGKATFEGGSIGLRPATVGTYDTKLESAFAETSRQLRQPLTVQAFVRGEELEVPLVELSNGVTSLRPVVISKSSAGTMSDDILAYDDMWDDEYAFGDLPGGTDWADKIVQIAVAASRVFPLNGFSRIDFRVDASGRPYIIDIASTPHLIMKSSFAYRFQSLGYTYGDMLLLLFGIAAQRHGWLYSSAKS